MNEEDEDEDENKDKSMRILFGLNKSTNHWSMNQ